MRREERREGSGFEEGIEPGRTNVLASSGRPPPAVRACNLLRYRVEARSSASTSKLTLTADERRWTVGDPFASKLRLRTTPLHRTVPTGPRRRTSSSEDGRVRCISRTRVK